MSNNNSYLNSNGNSNTRNRSNLPAMIEGALCIALTVVLAKINLFGLPQGGSVDLELVPLILFAWRRGLKLGLGIGFLTGIVKILLGAHIYNPIQIILDYPLAYMCAGLAAGFLSFFKNKLEAQVLGLIAAAMGQILCHTISGAVFFAQYAPEGQNPWIYSLLYNLPVMSIKYAVSGVVAWLLFQALNKAMGGVK